MRKLWARRGIRVSSIALLVVLVGVGAALATYLFTRPQAAADPAGDAAGAAQDRTVAAAIGTVRQSMSTTGTLTPAIQDQVNFAVSGTVSAVRVTTGQTVTKGELLATVDPLVLQAALASSRATVANANAKLVADKAAGALAAQLTADRAAIEVADHGVGTATANLADATLRAPSGGLVTAVNVVAGQAVTGSVGSSASAGAATTGGSATGNGGGNSGSGGNSGTSGSRGQGSAGGATGAGSSSADFVIVNTSSWAVNVSVDDAQVGLLATGDQAQISTDGSAGTLFGTVTSIGLMPSTSGSTASYPVVVTLTGPQSGLHDGTSVTAQLIYRQAVNVLTVPSAAVHSAGGSSTVTVVDPSGAKRTTTVTTGLSAGGLTQITSGLSEGDLVLVTVTAAAGTGITGSGAGGQRGNIPGAGSGNFPGSGAFPTGSFGRSGFGGRRGGN